MTRFPNLHRVGLPAVAAIFMLMSTTNLLAQKTTLKPDTPTSSASLEKLKKVVPIKVTVTTDKKAYAVGTPIKMTLLVKNATKQPVSLHFSSGQRFDFVLREGTKSDGKIVWQWARGRMFSMMLKSETLEPDAALTFAAVYDPASPDTSGKPMTPLTPGIYTLTGTLTTMGTELRATGAVQLTVK